MSAVKVSSKYQIVIPLEVRNSMGIRPGQEMQVFQIGRRIELVPVPTLEEIRGMAKGIDLSFVRDPDREL